MATLTPNIHSYQQYPQQQQQQHQQHHLVPHYGPNYDPYGYANYQVDPNQQRFQHQARPSAYNPSYTYSPTAPPSSAAAGGVPAQVHAGRNNASSEPSLLSNPSMPGDFGGTAAADDDDGMAEIIRSQQMAWKSAQIRNRQLPENPPAGTASDEMAASAPRRDDHGHRAGRLPEVPFSQNPTGSDGVHPHKAQMKQGRKVTTAAAATGGALIGAIVTGPAFPVGALIGGAVTGYTANKIHKQGERRAQRNWEQVSFQLGVHSAPASSQHAIV